MKVHVDKVLEENSVMWRMYTCLSIHIYIATTQSQFFYPFDTNGFFLLVRYNKLGIVHYTYLDVTCFI